jgi:hypothetical protein
MLETEEVVMTFQIELSFSSMIHISIVTTADQLQDHMEHLFTLPTWCFQLSSPVTKGEDIPHRGDFATLFPEVLTTSWYFW